LIRCVKLRFNVVINGTLRKLQIYLTTSKALLYTYPLHLYLDLGYFGLENWMCNLAASVSDIKTLIND